MKENMRTAVLNVSIKEKNWKKDYRVQTSIKSTRYLGKATPSVQDTYFKAGHIAVFPLATNDFPFSKDFFFPFPSEDLGLLNVAEFIMKQLTGSKVENFF